MILRVRRLSSMLIINCMPYFAGNLHMEFLIEACKEQEAKIGSYVDLLMRRLR
ncbi:hypothetical protein BX600DRAFT_462669 [Xylariales sp. PMI_506]|nr:hypothetical protein BX600DRAFT_462669 [Xylariales sp. PMI_506]